MIWVSLSRSNRFPPQPEGDEGVPRPHAPLGSVRLQRLESWQGQVRDLRKCRLHAMVGGQYEITLRVYFGCAQHSRAQTALLSAWPRSAVPEPRRGDSTSSPATAPTLTATSSAHGGRGDPWLRSAPPPMSSFSVPRRRSCTGGWRTASSSPRNSLSPFCRCARDPGASRARPPTLARLGWPCDHDPASDPAGRLGGAAVPPADLAPHRQPAPLAPGTAIAGGWNTAHAASPPRPDLNRPGPV